MTVASRIRNAVIGLSLGFAATGTAAAIGYVTARADVVIDAGAPIIAAPPVADTKSIAPLPPLQIDDPLANPAATIDDLAAAKRHGWPALVLAAAIVAVLALRSAGKRWPDVAWLAWLNTGKRAFWMASIVTMSSAATNALFQGGSAYAAGWAGLLAVLALANAKGES